MPLAIDWFRSAAELSRQVTAAVATLWSELPDLTLIHKAAFEGIDDAAIATAVSVLQIATERLDNLSRKGTDT